jgi:RND family efflux transporter MFP subunit
MSQSPSARRSKFALGLVAAAVIAVAGCGNPQSLPTASPPQPVTAQAAVPLTTASASVRIVPAGVADLAFVVSGPVKRVIAREGQVVRLGDALMELAAPELGYASTAAQEAVKSAEADESIQSQGRRKWDGTKFVWLSGPPEQRQLAHAHTLQAQAELDAARAVLAQATLHAPIDGTVASIAVSQGELVQSGEVVLVLADLSRMQAETTDLSEREIARVKVGQHASLRLKAFSNPIGGIVTGVTPMAGRSPNGDVIFKVTIDLEGPTTQLLWGMTGDVDIDTAG